MIYNIIDKVSNESSKKQKEILLKDNESVVLKQILHDTYNGFITYGIKKIELPSISGVNTLINDYDVVRPMLRALSTRSLTGNAARDTIHDVMATFTLEDQIIISRIIGRDMEAGFSASTINKVWKGLVPVFDVVLAERYDKFPDLLSFDGTWLLSRKLDGCRCVTIIKDGRAKFYSRKGLEFTTLRVVGIELEKIYAEIVETLKLVSPEDTLGDIVLDGEICLVDEYGNEDFQGIMKQIKKKDHTIENPKYQVFDLLSLDDFLRKESNSKLTDRLTGITNFLNKYPSDFVEVLEQVPVDSMEVFTEWNKKVSDFGWEGLMIRKDCGYKAGRTKDLLKVKKFFDAEYTVEDIICGEFNYSVAGQGQAKDTMMTAVKILHKGHEVKVGSGWSIDQRKQFFENPELIIGKTINVSYFEETNNKQGGISLRFPTVKYIYDTIRDT